MLANEGHCTSGIGCCLKCCVVLNQPPSSSPPHQKILYDYYWSTLIHWFDWYQTLAWFQPTESWRERRYSDKRSKQMSQSCVQQPVICLVLMKRGSVRRTRLCRETVSVNRGNNGLWAASAELPPHLLVPHCQACQHLRQWGFPLMKSLVKQL